MKNQVEPGTALGETHDELPPRETASPDGMEELRELLLGRERFRLAGLEKRIADPVLRSEDVGQVLPQAFTRCAKERDRLAHAMSPMVEAALHASIKRDPTALTNAIYPVIGSAIRKSIADTLRRLVQSFNHALERSLSLRGLGWRLEAWRTGRPFAEVVLYRTLVFRVEQVLLVHRPTGLLLLHATAPELEAANQDLISGMLSAIQDFMRDSFGAGPCEHLQTVRFGELSLWIETGPHAMLAAVVRGEAPMEFQRSLEDAVETIHREEAAALAAFAGDARPFESVRPHVEGCLQSQMNRPRRSPLSPAAAVGGIVLISLVAWGIHAWRERGKRQALLDALRAEPGLVINAVERRAAGRMRVTGWRDPLAADPAGHVTRAGLRPDAVEFRWEPFFALSPELTLRRARERLRPPAGIQMEVRDGVLVLGGSAPDLWWREAQERALVIPGIERVETHRLRAEDSLPGELARIRQTIETASVYFEFDQDASSSTETRTALAAVAKSARELRELARRSGAKAAVVIMGHTDSTGTAERNLRLRQERAGWVRQQLLAAEVPDDMLRVDDSGGKAPAAEGAALAEPSLHRRVTFAVTWQE